MKRSTKERQRAISLRKRMFRAKWEPFVKADSLRTGASATDRALAKHQKDDDAVYVNNRYQVHVNNADELHTIPGQTGMVWLSIKPRDGSAAHDWRDFQRIKNELLGEEWEAVELYPAESRMIDTVNQFHLWCFPPGVQFPIGWSSRGVMEENTTVFGSQRPWEDDASRPKDLKTEADVIAALALEENDGD